MKQKDIKPCAICGEGVMHNNQIMFLSIKLARMVADVGAVRQQAGLEMMLGSPTLANVMGPDADMAKKLEELNGLVCADCSLDKSLPLAELAELLSKGTNVTKQSGQED